MKTVEINNQKFEVVENENDCLDVQVVSEKLTDYFDSYDYIFGDYSYDKVRLKGFNDPKNKKANKINSLEYLDEYKREYCSYGAKTFLLKKVK